jgi:NADH:ubiquinone oxidoreductase subunit 5 (subunit L)/multisubunit Na+/H+ antiporter MnhA subunit
MLLLIMAGVIGAFLTGDIFNLYVWFEVLLISSFGLQVLGSERSQIDGGIKYAILNLVATTLFLLTTGYLYGIFGTLNMADIAVKAADMDAAAADDARRTLFARLRHEGCSLPGEFLAAGLLSHAARRGFGALRRAFSPRSASMRCSAR